MFVVLKTTSNTKQLFKSGAAPLYRSLVTSLHVIILYSHCEEHPWKLRSFNPDKRSIFALEEDGGEELCHAYSQQREEEEVKDKTPLTGQATEINNSTTVTCSEQSPDTCLEGSSSKENGVTSTEQATVRHSEQLCTGDREQQGGLTVTSPSKTTTTAGKLASIKGTSSKTFVICGGNAAPL